MRRASAGEPKTLDPQLADDTFSFPIVRDLFEGLTAEDPAGNVEPGIAREWSVSEDGLTYSFYLREDARWSNGDPITADEFVAGLKRAADPKTASGSAALLAVVENGKDVIAGRKPVDSLAVSAPQAREVRIKLEHPAPYILQILSQPIAAPLHARTAPKDPLAERDGAALFDGPYILSKRVPGAFIELARNPKYWHADAVKIGRVRYVTLESESSELREYLADQLEMTSTIPMPDMKRISAQFPAELQIEPVLGTFFLALNLTEPPFRNARELRKALSMAVDRDMITGSVMSRVAPAYSFVADGIHGYAPPKYDWAALPHEERIKQAQAIYKAAGYSMDHPLRVKLYFNNNETIRRVMIAVAGSWQQNLGVVTEFVSDEFRVFLDGRKDRKKWDAVRLGWNADYDDATSFLEIFGKANNQDDSGYQSEQFNALLDAARTEARAPVRRATLENAERVLLNDYPIIPIYFYNSRRLVKPYVGGATITPLNRTYSRHLYWKLGA